MNPENNPRIEDMVMPQKGFEVDGQPVEKDLTWRFHDKLMYWKTRCQLAEKLAEEGVKATQLGYAEDGLDEAYNAYNEFIANTHEPK